MKKFVAVLLAAVLCLSFAACGGEKATDKTVDAAAMFKALLNDVTYTDNATELDSSMAGVLLGGDCLMAPRPIWPRMIPPTCAARSLPARIRTLPLR